MKKQIIIFSLICLAIIVVAGAYYFYVKKPAVIIDNNIPEQEQAEETAVQALDVKNISDCDGLASQTDKNTCRQAYTIKQAADSGDLNKCSEAADKILAADCTAQASFSLAIQKKDKKYCENIINQTDKENCFKVLDGMGVK